MVRYPPLVLSFAQAHLCDTPFCYISRDNCAIPLKTSTKSFARLLLQVSRDMKSIAAGPLSLQSLASLESSARRLTPVQLERGLNHHHIRTPMHPPTAQIFALFCGLSQENREKTQISDLQTYPNLYPPL